MATYKHVQEYFRFKNGQTCKSCWIAHVLSDNGVAMRTAPNRKDPSVRVHPCPANKRSAVEDALRHHKMIR